MANTWLDTDEYPFHLRYFKVNGHRLHYIDEGQGESILFVHGTPSWSFDFRNVVKKLRGNYRCIAIDHIGFGLSDKPEHYDYSTRNHSKTLESLVLREDLRDLTLVVHDFGGPIGLDFAIRNPERIKRLIILNSWLWSSRNDADFIRLSRVLKSPLLPFLYRYFNFSPRFILPRSFGGRPLSKHLLSKYTRPFADKTQRNGALTFARSLLHDQDWFESLWHRRSVIAGKPALFIWGMKDRMITPAYLSRFQSGFPNSRAILLETCGHFPQEEEAESVTESIREFLRENGNQN